MFSISYLIFIFDSMHVVMMAIYDFTAILSYGLISIYSEKHYPINTQGDIYEYFGMGEK